LSIFHIRRFVCLCLFSLSLLLPPPPISTLFPYTTLFRSRAPRPEWLEPLSPFPICLGLDHDRLTLRCRRILPGAFSAEFAARSRSEEHTSELQSRFDLVCRLLLEKKKIPAAHLTPLRLRV